MLTREKGWLVHLQQPKHKARLLTNKFLKCTQRLGTEGQRCSSEPDTLQMGRGRGRYSRKAAAPPGSRRFREALEPSLSVPESTNSGSPRHSRQEGPCVPHLALLQRHGVAINSLKATRPIPLQSPVPRAHLVPPRSATPPTHLVPPTFSCTISPLPAAAAAKPPQCPPAMARGLGRARRPPSRAPAAEPSPPPGRSGGDLARPPLPLRSGGAGGRPGLHLSRPVGRGAGPGLSGAIGSRCHRRRQDAATAAWEEGPSRLRRRGRRWGQNSAAFALRLLGPRRRRRRQRGPGRSFPPAQPSQGEARGALSGPLPAGTEFQAFAPRHAVPAPSLLHLTSAGARSQSSQVEDGGHLYGPPPPRRFGRGKGNAPELGGRWRLHVNCAHAGKIGGTVGINIPSAWLGHLLTLFTLLDLVPEQGFRVPGAQKPIVWRRLLRKERFTCQSTGNRMEGQAQKWVPDPGCGEERFKGSKGAHALPLGLVLDLVGKR